LPSVHERPARHAIVIEHAAPTPPPAGIPLSSCTPPSGLFIVGRPASSSPSTRDFVTGVPLLHPRRLEAPSSAKTQPLVLRQSSSIAHLATCNGITFSG